MDDFGTLARDFGFRPQGKSAPMAAPKSNISLGSSGYAPIKSSSSFTDRGGDGFSFDDVFGGPPKYTPSAGGTARSSALDHDSKSPSDDKPVYDDDIFHGLHGMKAPSDSSAKHDDVFGSLSSRVPRHKDQHTSQFDDLLGDLDRLKADASAKVSQVERDLPIFDDLLSGFSGTGLSSMRRPTSEPNSSKKPSSSSTKVNSNVMEDPFVVLESISTHISSSAPVSPSGLFTDPLDDFTEFSSSGSSKVYQSHASATVFDDVDPLDIDSLGNSVPPVSSEFNRSPLGTGPRRSTAASPVGKEQTTKLHAENFEKYSPKKMPVDNFQDQFVMSSTSPDFLRTAGRATSPPSYANATANEINTHMGGSPRHEEKLETSRDIWLTVSEVPLFTQRTRAPPPSRPPPPRPTRVSKSETRSPGYTNTRNKSNDFSSFHNSARHSYSPKSAHGATMTPVASQIDDFENFAMGGTQNNVSEHAAGGGKSDPDAAAMKEAMDRAEAKFRHAKEVRERDHRKTSRSRESVHLEKDEKTMQDGQEKDLGQKQERLDCEREREEEEREQRRLEKEREQRRLEKAREIEREKEKARQAVERATREARERAAAEARLRAERAAVEKAQAEARERAERAAVQRAQAEARERAAAEAKERAEKAAAEARERTRASTSRVEAEVRSRAERASVQQKNDDDLESFFSMGTSRTSSTSRANNSSDPLFDTEAQSKEGPDFSRRTSVGASSNIRKASSSTNAVDDLTSLFGAAPSSGGFHEIEGETEERRRARLERHQRTQERAAKALAEKNEHDLQLQREQAERHRIAETLDVEIKRWAAGKEGNLRALLSTLQYVLWPECRWQPVSLTDLITAAAVKKAYRKATLCIHPDKVQQKGANLQQKYVAEKVFDLLKEAWNKFNSEELF